MTSSLAQPTTTGTAVVGPMVHPTAVPCLRAGEQTLAILIDRRRELAARVAGLDIEIAMALGDRDGARKAMKEMQEQIGARIAVREAGCYFHDAGARDAAVLQRSAN